MLYRNRYDESFHYRLRNEIMNSAMISYTALNLSLSRAYLTRLRFLFFTAAFIHFFVRNVSIV